VGHRRLSGRPPATIDLKGGHNGSAHRLTRTGDRQRGIRNRDGTGPLSTGSDHPRLLFILWMARIGEIISRSSPMLCHRPVDHHCDRLMRNGVTELALDCVLPCLFVGYWIGRGSWLAAIKFSVRYARSYSRATNCKPAIEKVRKDSAIRYRLARRWPPQRALSFVPAPPTTRALSTRQGSRGPCRHAGAFSPPESP